MALRHREGGFIDTRFRRGRKLPSGRWSGPFRSGYGWHLVYVTHLQQPTLPPFHEVRDRVTSDYRDEQRHVLNAQAYENLRSKYKIEYESDR